MAPVFALPLGFLNKRVAHSLLRAASRTCHDHRCKFRRSLERGIRARASSRSAGSKSRVLARSFPLEVDVDSIETALYLMGLSLEQAATAYNAHQIFLFALGDAEKMLFHDPE
jgi:hypothetical protein